MLLRMINVISGPFAGKSGTVESIDFEKETAKVLIDFLGNQTPMEIDLVALEKHSRQMYSHLSFILWR